MKKIMMTLAAAIVAVSASAQVYVGGTVGFLGSKSNADNAKTATKFEINPEVGYNFSDSWAVGVNVGFGSEKGTWKDNGYGSAGDGEKAITTFTVAPYARFTYAKLGNVSLFLDGKVSYTTKKDDYNEYGVNIVPGVAFAASDKVSFVAKMGNGLGWNQMKDKNSDTKFNRFGLDVNSLSALEFGMYFNF
ncbi:MAG: porin family protein [Prevotella sp.]|nr:porin family protein [Prevotella sp.]